MLVAFFRLLSFLPLPVLHTLGSALGYLVYWSVPSYRRRLRTNLGRAGYAHLLPDAIGHAGKTIAELPFIWCASAERVARHAIDDNWELVQAARDAGRGIVFLTPHLGCFEITAQQIARRISLTAMYRPPRKAMLKPLIEGARARHNLLLAPANLGGVRILAKTLKSGQAVGVLPDQVPQEGEGVWSTWFGHPAYTMTLPAKLARLGSAQVILVYAERLAAGQGFKVRFVPFDGDLSGPPEQQARAINLAMEQLIAHCPAQYFWSYNRYKAPEGSGAPQDPNP